MPLLFKQMPKQSYYHTMLKEFCSGKDVRAGQWEWNGRKGVGWTIPHFHDVINPSHCKYTREARIPFLEGWRRLGRRRLDIFVYSRRTFCATPSFVRHRQGHQNASYPAKTFVFVINGIFVQQLLLRANIQHYPSKNGKEEEAWYLEKVFVIAWNIIQSRRWQIIFK